MRNLLILLLFSLTSVSLFAGYPSIAVHHPNIGGLYDTVIHKGDSFDPMNGVMAYDYYDGYITDKVQVSGSVDTQTPGDYTLTYTVTNTALDTKTFDRKVTVLPAGDIAILKTTGRRGPNDIIDLDESYQHRLVDNLTFIKPVIIAPYGTTYEYKLINYKWDITESDNPNVGVGHKETEPSQDEWDNADTREFYKDLYFCIKPRMDRWLKIIITNKDESVEYVFGLKGDEGVQFTSTLDGETYYHLSKEVDDPQTSEEQYKYFKHGSTFWFPENNVILKKMGSRAKVTTLKNIQDSYDMFDYDEIHGIYTLARAFGPGSKFDNTEDNWNTIMNGWNHALSENMNASYRRSFEVFFSECKMGGWMDSFEEHYREIRENYNPKRIYVAVSNYGKYYDYKHFYDEESPYFQFEWHKGHFPKMFDNFVDIGKNYHCYAHYPRINEVFSPANAAASFQTHRDIHTLAQQNRVSAALMDKCGFLYKLPDNSDWSKFALMYWAMWFCYDGFDFLNNGDYFRDDWDGDRLSNADELKYDLDPFNPDTDGDQIYDADEVLFGLDPKTPNRNEDFDNDRISNFNEVIRTVETRYIGGGTPAFKPVTNTDEDGNVTMMSPSNPEDAQWDSDHDLLPAWFEIGSNGNPIGLHTFKDGSKGYFIWMIDVAKEYSDVTKMIAYNNGWRSGSSDIDGDGLKNLKELRYGLDAENPDDIYEDMDGDGIDNITEINDGTSMYGDDTDGPVFNVQIVKKDAFADQLYNDTLWTDVTAPDVGEKFTFTKTDGPAWLTIKTTGLLEGTPDSSDVGENTFSVEVADNSGRTAQATFVITVNAAATKYTLTVNNGSNSGDYAEGSEINITAETAPKNQIFDRWTGDVDTINNIFDSQTTLTMPSNDITVTAVYTDYSSTTRPHAYDDEYTVKYERTLVKLRPGVMMNDADPDNDAISAIQTSSPSHGALVFNTDGSFTYTPEKGFWGTDSFTYKVSDGSLESEEATVTINITNVAVQSSDDKFSMLANSTLTLEAPGILSNDINKEPDTLTVKLVDDVSDGTLTLNKDGSFSYTPNTDFVGDDEFTYTVNDGYNDGNTAKVTITVYAADSNVPPTVFDDDYTVDENQTLHIDADGVLENDFDVNSDNITAVMAHYPSHGTLNLNSNGSFEYTPETGYYGIDSFTYRANDGTEASKIATVTITVNLVSNIPPVANADSYSTNQDTELVIEQPGVLQNDTDTNNDTLTAILVSPVSNGILDFQADGSFTYTPNNGFSGTDEFTYKVNDGQADSSEVTVTINVSGSSNNFTDPTSVAGCELWLDGSDPVGDGSAPVAGDITQWSDKSGNNNNATEYTSNDGTAPVPEVELNAQNGLSAIKFTPDEYLAFPQLNDIRTVFWVIREDNQTNQAQDGHFLLGDESNYDFSRGESSIWHKDYASDAVKNGVTKILTDGTMQTIDGTTENIPLNEFTIVSLSTTDSVQASFVTADRANAFTSGNNRGWSGEICELIIYNKELSDTDRAQVENYLYNKWFSATPQSYTLKVNNGQGSGEYEENSQVTITADIPDGKIFKEWTGDVQYIDDANSASTTVTMPNKDITITATFEDIPENSYNISGHISIDNAGLAAVTVSAGNQSAITDSNGNYTIQGLLDGDYTVTPVLKGYTFNPESVNTTIGGADKTEINFTAFKDLVDTNNTPVALNDSYFVKENTSLTVEPKSGLLANDYDIDDDSLTVKVLGNPADITVNNDGSFVYTGSTSITFKYVVNDGKIDSAPAKVTITVIPEDKEVPPVAIGDKFKTAQNSILYINPAIGVLANDLSAEGASVELVTETSNGKLTLNPDGSFTYEPNKDFSGTDFFTYKITDSNPESSAKCVILVNPIQVTLGSMLSFTASSIEELNGTSFAKVPKLYGILENGKKGGMKKVKKSTPEEFYGVWAKTVKLYDKKTLKASSYILEAAMPAQTVKIKVKGKTVDKAPIDKEILTVQIVPPVITELQNASGETITTASAGESIQIKGKFFGLKTPKVSLLSPEGKLLKCKVEKTAFIYKDYKEKLSPMDSVSGDSMIVITLPVKKIVPGDYPIILDNKVGIATTPYIDETDKGHLPVINIK